MNTYNFYLGEQYNKLLLPLVEGSYDPQTLEWVPGGGYFSTLTFVELKGQYLWVDKIFKGAFAKIMYYDKDEKYLASYDLRLSKKQILAAATGSKYMLITFKASEEEELDAYTQEDSRKYKYIDFIYNIQTINPVYKSLTKRYGKESGQEFFRETLEGNITLQGDDFLKVYNAELNTSFAFLVYKDATLYFRDFFTKVSCTFDYAKRTCKPKLLKRDQYAPIMDKYDVVYDLYKLRVPTATVGLLKRPAIQIYVSGSQKVTTTLDGVFWEGEVTEEQSDATVLDTKYHFVRNGAFGEFQIIQNDTVVAAFGGSFENSYSIYGCDLTSVDSTGKPSGKLTWRCELVKVASRSDPWEWENANDSLDYKYFYGLYSRQKETAYGTTTGASNYMRYRRDAYVLRLYSGNSSYYWQSRQLFYIDDENLKVLGIGGNIPFWQRVGDIVTGAVELEVLGVNEVFARLLCDVDSFTDVQGDVHTTYDLPYEDFVQDSRNYKKCYGVNLGRIFITYATSVMPTRYGQNDTGLYFARPASENGLNIIPLDQSQWINFATWYAFSESYQLLDKAASKKYYLRDAHHIADVIQVLLNEIAPGIKHKATPEYSQFLYSTNNSVRGELLYLFMTQKTNILKGEYDQAAKKVEVSLEDVMNMLQKCFKCYFWIENSKLKIEHISWFQNGGGYAGNAHKVGLDLTAKKDKFNKVYPGYFQSELSYDMQSLPARYSFEYMDDHTEAFSGISFEVEANYVDTSKSEDITVGSFATDIDYMLISPNSFSEDGFVLIGAKHEDNEYICPVLEQTLVTDEGVDYKVRVQNGYLAWSYLLKYYMYDLPALTLQGHVVKDLTPVSTTRFMEHTVKVPLPEDFNNQETVVTTAGEGIVQQIDTDLHSQIATIKLAYEAH